MNKLGLKILKIVGIVSFVCVVILITSNVLIFKVLFSELQQDAAETVSESVAAIDAVQLQKVIDSHSMDSWEYQQIQQAMMEFKNDRDIKYFYTMARGGEDTAYILVDAALVDNSPLGEEYELEAEMIEAFSGAVSYTKTPVEDDYGTFISAYAPIKNSAGEIIAIAGVDKDVAYLMAIRSSVMMTTIGVGVLLIVLSVLLSLVFSRKISSGIKQLTEGRNRQRVRDEN